MTEPEVSVPAVMRNYHEVLRNDLAKVLAPRAEAGDLAGVAVAWQAYVRAIAVHAAMEDGVAGAGGGITTMLDQFFDGAVNAALFRAEHADEHELQAAVTRALPFGAGALRDAWAAYRACAEAHLQHEEDIMMPLVARLPLEGKAALFAEWCVSAGVAHGGFDTFIAHGVASLATFGSTKNTPAGATRVFAQSLRAVTTPAHWAQLLPVVRNAAGPAVWAAVSAEVPSLEAASARAA
jgi:hypothetical protein